MYIYIRGSEKIKFYEFDFVGWVNFYLQGSISFLLL